ncbi:MULTISPECIES: ribose 5-phosphate isomerase B [unclassified Fusibacter]|uniref:ribose 5-phosphate isomerase B n=1 Tax=unclassified Fusibacter TaxID=2624464 RepID=UPI001012390D|nr:MULTISPECIES: ribose 5-phosphate isomerase B [unclassified Fusibacter]MCK8059874.1 ribose 5-phosphate isomerase B [Fusibacter sp. A2]NPE21676.1 ribose 5-phosphate isomerase B [Fusibacter sp. A1]RXV62079.1 ribose 5-phosphate isomerase B [Fusibacter sp. A1]
MKIALGCDHGGFALKEEIAKHLAGRGFEVVDFGTYSTESVDYPDYSKKAADAVVSGECERGILICGTGQGIMMAANKVKGIRCAVLSDVFSAEMTRMHNDANMIALGGRVVGVGLALRIVDAYLDAQFEGGRHQTRIDKIMEIEA